MLGAGLTVGSRLSTIGTGAIAPSMGRRWPS